MTRRKKVAALTATVFALIAVPALAGAQLKTTIALDGASSTTRSTSSASGPATFDVTRSYAYNKDTIWVVNRCWDAAGTLVVSDASAVVWGTWESLEGNAGPMYTAGTRCSAHVSIRGKQSGSAINYSVE